MPSRKPAVRNITKITGANPVKRYAHPEDDLQQSVVEFLTVALPSDAVFAAVPNGGRRNAREAARMKAAGVRAGMPDLLVFHGGRVTGIELKAPKTATQRAGVVTEVQRDTMEALRTAGIPCWVCHSLDEVEDALRANGVPLRGRTSNNKENGGKHG